MEKPRPQLLQVPPQGLTANNSLRFSQEQQISATAFGRALLERTRAIRAKHIVVDKAPEQWTCPICDSTFTISSDKNGGAGLVAAPLGSGHQHAVYCHHCLTQWIEAQLSDNCCEVRCLIEKCPVRLEPEQMSPVLSSKLIKKWDAALLMAALKAMPDLRYCPVCHAPGFLVPACGDAECIECKYQFCATCMLPKHAAIRCSAAVYELDPDVQRRFYEDRLAAQWKEQHTKACPQCKNEGCSHMTCKNCSYQFCWICLRKFQGKYVTGAAANGTVCPCPPGPTPIPAPAPTTAASVKPAAAAAAAPTPAATTPAAAKPAAASAPRP